MSEPLKNDSGAERDNDNLRDIIDSKIEEVLATVKEKFDVEAIAQMVEQMDFNEQLNQKIQRALDKVWDSLGYQGNQFGAVQSHLRDLMMDMALVKRALTSIGQVGVLQRQKIEKELLLEVFPPGDVKEGVGISVVQSTSQVGVVDKCAERRALCKSACCRIFNVPLTPKEVRDGELDWNPRSPYNLSKNRLGCVHLNSTDNHLCKKYGCRPSVCVSYSCQNDQRIWENFDEMKLSPLLAKQLESLGLKTPEQSMTETNSDPSEEKHDNQELCPPDFEKLRAMIPPEPKQKFSPPEKDLSKEQPDEKNS